MRRKIRQDEGRERLARLGNCGLYSKFHLFQIFQIPVFFMLLLIFFALPLQALGQTRSLKIYYIHTREKAEVIYKKDGRYVESGLKKLNYLLRDWRRNEPTNMDPRLFDLIWQVYKMSGSRDYIHVVSAYRSPATNNMLRSKSASSGVAKNSQHTLGKAMDFYLPDVNLVKLRQIGLKQEAGGVGYYPTSGSPFIHLDVGSVRHWPRMNRKELMALFPDGKTIHVPSDGKPLEGYATALNAYNARKGALPAVIVAKDEKEKGEKKTLMASLFGKKRNKDSETSKPLVTRQPANDVRGANGKTESNLVEITEIVTEIALPEDNAPIPLASPFRHLLKEQEEKQKEDPIGDFLVAQAGNGVEFDFVPIPVLKAKPSLPQTAYIPTLALRPTPPPLETKEPLSEPPLASNLNKAPNAENQRANKNENEQEIEGLIAWADNQETIVPLPDDNGMNEPVYTENFKGNLSEPAKNLPEIDQDTIRTIIAQAFDVDERDEQMVASITPATTPKQDKPQLDELGELIARDELENLGKISLQPEEIKQIPELVFVSGLQKRQKLPVQPKLSGKAINFPPVARIGSID